MRKQCAFADWGLVMLAFLCFSTLTKAQSKQEPSRKPENANHTSVTADLAQGGSFTFKIGPNLPDFIFKVIPDHVGPDERGNTYAIVRDIEVFHGDSKQSSQHLTGCNWSDMEPPSEGADWLSVEDINFDGYKDIYVMTWWGATGNQGGCWWLYNPATEHFEFSKEFSELSVRRINPDEKTILTFSVGGQAGIVHDAERYRVENNKPVLIWHENQNLDLNRKEFHCVVQELRGGKMVTILDEWGEWGKTSDDLGPCDPGRLFR
jgi:hypothetical protein